MLSHYSKTWVPLSENKFKFFLVDTFESVLHQYCSFGTANNDPAIWYLPQPLPQLHNWRQTRFLRWYMNSRKQTRLLNWYTVHNDMGPLAQSFLSSSCDFLSYCCCVLADGDAIVVAFLVGGGVLIMLISFCIQPITTAALQPASKNPTHSHILLQICLLF